MLPTRLRRSLVCRFTTMLLPLLAAGGPGASLAASADAVEMWDIFEITLQGPEDEAGHNAFEVELHATFLSVSGASITARGFFDGGDVYKVRFSPGEVGAWSFVTASPCKLLDGHRGDFYVTSPTGANHGPVEARGYGLYYADGTPYFSVGTTCYQWASEDPEMQAQTLKTLSAAGFNKIRMTVFPKW